MSVKSKADISRLVGRHQITKNYSFPFIRFKQRCCRIPMLLGAEYLVYPRIPLQTVKEPLGTVIIAFFACILMVGSAVFAFFRILLSCFYKLTVFIKQTNAVLLWLLL